MELFVEGMIQVHPVCRPPSRQKTSLLVLEHQAIEGRLSRVRGAVNMERDRPRFPAKRLKSRSL